jgi:flagellar export protein FliJ
MPPRFSLQTVLDVRHSRVEGLEIELSQLNLARQQGVELLENFQGQQNGYLEDLKKSQTKDIDLFSVSMLHNDIERIKVQIQQVHDAIAILDEKIIAKRQELIIAKQDEEVLKTLKGKENERYVAELALQEGKAIDDIYISRAYRQHLGI